jgi:hypothetical protein
METRMLRSRNADRSFRNLCHGRGSGSGSLGRGGGLPSVNPSGFKTPYALGKPGNLFTQQSKFFLFGHCVELYL